jgi:hypothetical protein
MSNEVDGGVIDLFKDTIPSFTWWIGDDNENLTRWLISGLKFQAGSSRT